MLLLELLLLLLLLKAEKEAKTSSAMLVLPQRSEILGCLLPGEASGDGGVLGWMKTIALGASTTGSACVRIPTLPMESLDSSWLGRMLP
jgi:hypothetical protein